MVKLGAMRLTKAAELVEAKAHETLTYFAFPSNHWRQVKTNNPLERIIREIGSGYRRRKCERLLTQPPGLARAVHACPLVERGGSSVGGARGRRLVAAGIRSCG